MKRLKVIGSPFALYKNPMWVKSYADTPCGRGRVVLTSHEAEALQFTDVTEALAFWRQRSRSMPMRPDGKPNRPITAYSVEIA